MPENEISTRYAGGYLLYINPVLIFRRQALTVDVRVAAELQYNRDSRALFGGKFDHGHT